MPSAGSTAGTAAFASGFAGPTAQQLIRGLGRRMREFFLSNPTSPGSQTTLIDLGITKFIPQDIVSQFNAWVSGVPGADAANVGFEARATSWTVDNATLTLYTPGFPVAVTGGPYEVHIRFPRSDILEAINDAVGQLGMTWYREVKDESLVSVQQQWRYVAPATQHWTIINKIEIQINTDEQATAGGYPFAPADYLNPRVERDVDSTGVEVWAIQFGLQPPPGRIIRLWGEAFYPDVVQDADYLPLAGEWQRPALTWIYSWGQFQLNDWVTNQSPTGETAKIRQQALDQLERQKDALLATAPPHKPGMVVTPGRGDGYTVSSPEDWRYLGAFRSAAFTRGGG